MGAGRQQVVRMGLLMSSFTFASFLYIPFIAPLIDSILRASELYGLSVEQWLGVLAAVSPLTVILGTHLIGSLSDEHGRKKIVLAGMLFSLLSVAVYVFARGPLLFILARALEVLGYTTVTLITLAKVNDLTKDATRGWHQGVFLSIQYLGNMVGPVVGGWLTKTYFPTAPFLMAGVVFVALLVVLIRLPGERFHHRHKASLSILKNWKEFLGFRKLKGMAILGAAMHAHAPILIFFMPLYILQIFPGRYEYIGYAAFAFSALKPLQFVAGKMVDTYGKARLTLVGCILSGLALFLIPTADTIWGLLGVMLLFSAGGALWNVGAWTVMSVIGEANNIEGHVIGSYMSIAKIGDLAGSIAAGWIAGLFGIAALFPFGAAVIMLGILASLFFLRDLPERQ